MVLSSRMWVSRTFMLILLQFILLGNDQMGCTIEAADDGVSLECRSNNMTLYVHKNREMYENDTITLLNTTCTGTTNHTHFMVSTNYQDCGTSHVTTNNSSAILFKNTAVIVRYIGADELVMRHRHVEKMIEMKCSFPSFTVTRSGDILLQGDGYSPWSAYGACSRSCGGGNQTSTRNCLMSTSNRCSGTTTRTRKCNSNPCPQTCKTLECTKEFTVCVESFNTSLPAKCDCRAGFVQVDRECKTSENIVRVVFFKLNITFKEEYKDVKNPVTLELKTRIEQSLHRTLNLSAYEYVAVTNITRGSVIVDFVVLLAQNSTDNKLSIEEKLRTEVRTNKTGHLHEYFPVSRQAIVVLDTDLCKLSSDSCNMTHSTCKATPGVGFNFRCNCKPGYVQETIYTCSKPVSKPDPKTNTDELRLILILVFIGLFVLLFFVCCFLVVRRRRQRAYDEQAEDVADDGMMVYNDSIFEGPSRFSRKMRAYSVYRDNPDNLGIEATKYRDIPDQHVFGHTFRS